MSNKKDYVYASPMMIEYRYYLDEEVTETQDYHELFELLANAGENDTVRIIISNYGGSLTTCVALVNAIRSTRAKTVGVLTSVAYSAAGAIWLACEAQEVHNHVGFMGHDAISGNYGSLYQQWQSLGHTMTILRSLYEDVYQYFLSQEEIETVLRNGDLWLTEKQIISRLEKRQDLFDKEHQAKQQENLSDFLFEEEVPEELLLKLTKKQLVDYAMGKIDVSQDDNGKLIITKVEEND